MTRSRSLFVLLVVHSSMAWLPLFPLYRLVSLENGKGPSTELKRSTFLASILGSSLVVTPQMAIAFEGGVGGLGKTKPETGVKLWDAESIPIQNPSGLISAELVVNQRPARVSFQTPWPLLPTSGGIEARELQNPESAFVQIVEGVKGSPSSRAAVKQLLLESVLSQKGKFGAYGAPIDVKVKATDMMSVYRVTFTSYTPGQRESEREMLVRLTSLDNALVLFVVGTTHQRFTSKEKLLRQIVDSFEAVSGPATTLRRVNNY